MSIVPSWLDSSNPDQQQQQQPQHLSPTQLQLQPVNGGYDGGNTAYFQQDQGSNHYTQLPNTHRYMSQDEYMYNQNAPWYQQQQQQTPFDSSSVSPMRQPTPQPIPQLFQQPIHSNNSPTFAQQPPPPPPPPTTTTTTTISSSRPQQQNLPHFAPQSGTPPQPYTPQQVQQLQQRAQHFMQSLHEFMSKRGTPIQARYAIDGKPINLFQLYALVMREGTSSKVSANNLWSRVAQMCDLPVDSDPSIAQQLQDLYKTTLGAYEETFIKVQLTRLAQQRQQQHQQQQQSTLQPQQVQGPPPQSNTPPLSQPPQQQQQVYQAQIAYMLQQQQKQMQEQQLKQQAEAENQRNITAPQANSTSSPKLTPRRRSTHTKPTPKSVPLQKSASQNAASHAATPPANTPPQLPITASVPLNRMTPEFPTPKLQKSASVNDQTGQMSRNESLHRSASPAAYVPVSRTIETHGGWDIGVLFKIDSECHSAISKTVPYSELGSVNIHALIMSLKSGLAGEITVALDTLMVITGDATSGGARRSNLHLGECLDLLDALLECTDECITKIENCLPNHSTTNGHSEAIFRFPTYEQLMRSCSYDIQTCCAPTKQKSEVRKHVAELICIFGILRNLLYYEPNQDIIGNTPLVLDIICDVICLVHKTMETSELICFIAIDRLDLLKDCIVILSCIGHNAKIESVPHMGAFLSLVLIFAPISECVSDEQQFSPDATMSPVFMPLYRSTFEPPYLATAIDFLAKVLVRDQPNVDCLAHILENNPSAGTPRATLSRLFAMTMFVIPDVEAAADSALFMALEGGNEQWIATLEQALLAANVLVTLITQLPALRSLSATWLSMFHAPLSRLIRLACILAGRIPQIQRSMNQNNRHQTGFAISYFVITQRSLAIVTRLIGATLRYAPTAINHLRLSGLFGKKDMLVDALLVGELEGSIVKGLWDLEEMRCALFERKSIQGNAQSTS